MACMSKLINKCLAKISILTEVFAKEIIRCHLTWHGEVDNGMCIEMGEFFKALIL